MQLSAYPMSGHPGTCPRTWICLSRTLLVASVVATALVALPAHAAFSFATVEAKAQSLAQKPYQKPPDTLPKALAELDHTQYQSIHYKPQARLWADAHGPFTVGFMMNGSVYHDTVNINEVDADGVHPVHFDPDNFSYGPLKLKHDALAKAGFSGLAVHFRFPTQGGKSHHKAPADDNAAVLVFQGASFFHALGRGQVAGASARGLAIDTGLMSGEEFPRFKEFWIERPASSDHAMVIDALMVSKRATGAYRFALYPGTNTRVEVRARIFLRNYVTVLGLAPINSMYLYGENEPKPGAGDYRPEVHDSDGLQIHSGTGEWLWRPLVNPSRLLITSFSMTNPQGFGLMQRDRRFSDYEDLKARYDQRPSVWVTPEGNWGPGRIELVELPTPDQTHDNIVAFWVPDTPPKPQQPLDIAYRIQWQSNDETYPPSSWVTQTRVGHGFSTKDHSGIGFVIDFAGPALDKLSADTAVTGVVSVNGNGKIAARHVIHNDVTGGWRLLLRLKRMDAHKPVELRAYLRSGHNTVSETWSYILPPT